MDGNVASPTLINIESNDGEAFQVAKEVIQMSRKFQRLLRIRPSLEEKIPLTEIDGPTFKVVVEWCEKHQGEPERRTPSYVLVPITDWDADFLTRNYDLLISLRRAADYLVIKGLSSTISSYYIEAARNEANGELFGYPALPNYCSN